MPRFSLKIQKLNEVVRTTLRVAVVGAFLFAISSHFVVASPSLNRMLNYQLRLTDPSGIPVADGAKSLKLTVYDAASGGNQLYTACSADGSATGTPTAVQVNFAGGTGSVLIGSTSVTCASGSAVALPATLFNDDQAWLGVTVAADSEMTPRKRIVAAAYSLNADRLDDLETSAIGGTNAFVPVTDSSGNLTLSANVTVDTNTLFVDSANNRVGVGTASPTAPLTIVSNTTHLFDATRNNLGQDTVFSLSDAPTSGSNYSQILFGIDNDGSVMGYAPGGAFLWTGKLGTGTSYDLTLANYSTTKGIVFVTGIPLTEKMRIATGGNVGIGTSSPATRLHVVTEDTVNGAMTFDNYSDTVASALVLRRARGNVSSPGAVLSGDALGSWLVRGYHSGGGFGTDNVGGVVAYATENFTSTAQGTTLRFGTAANGTVTRNDRLVIDQNGNVGIGPDTTPDLLLDVQGTFGFEGDGTFGDASGDAITSNAASWTFANDTVISLSGGVDGLNFDANTLSIDAANNRIGIGTNAPTQQFDLVASTVTPMRIRSTATDAAIFFDNTTSTDYTVGIANTGAGAPLGSFYVYDTGSAITRLQVSSGGNVGLSLPLGSNAASRLEVRGSGTSSSTSGLNVTDSSGGTNLFVRDDGFVGINTASPNAPLHLVNAIAPDIRIEETSAGAGAQIYYQNVTRTWDMGSDASPDGFYLSALGSALGQSMFFLNPSGQLGLGTSSPDQHFVIGSSTSIADEVVKITGQADAVLQLFADTDNVTETDNPYVHMTQDFGTGREAFVGIVGNAGADPSNGSYTGTLANVLFVGNSDAVPIQFGTGDVVRMTIGSTGLVGIGTTGPGAMLHVSGSTQPHILAEQTTVGAAAQIELKNSSRTWRLDADASPDVLDLVDVGASSVPLSIEGTAPTGTVYIDSSGRVGVGVTNPATFKIQVAGAVGPNSDDAFDLGSDALRWRDLYLGPATLHVGTAVGDEGALAYNTTTNVLAIDSTGAVEINGGSGSTGCTIDASGNFVCSGTVSGGGGAAFVNDGNSLGGAATIGTNDNFPLNIETNGAVTATFSTTAGVWHIPNNNSSFAISDSGASVLGTNSTAVGYASDATGNQATSFGNLAQSTGTGAVALGYNTAAVGNGVAIGRNASGTSANHVAIGSSASVTGGNGIAIGLSAVAGNSDSIALGANATTTNLNQIVVGSSSIPITDIVFGGGAQMTTAPTGFTLRATNAVTTADLTGASLTIAGGRGTGTGVGGSLVFQTAAASLTSGATQNNLAERMRIDSAGNVGIGTASAQAMLQLHKTAGSDPSFYLSDGDVAHGVTDAAPTDTFGKIGAINSTNGGLDIQAFNDGQTDEHGTLRLWGVLGDGNNANPVVVFRAGAKSGTGTTALGDNRRPFQFQRNNGLAFVTIMGNGDVGIGLGKSTATATAPDAVLDVSTSDTGARNIAANANGRIVRFAGGLNEASSGTHAVMAGLELNAPSINNSGATVTDAATLYVSAAPAASGANNYALFADSGASRFDGAVSIGTDSAGTAMLKVLSATNSDNVLALATSADGGSNRIQLGSSGSINGQMGAPYGSIIASSGLFILTDNDGNTFESDLVLGRNGSSTTFEETARFTDGGALTTPFGGFGRYENYLAYSEQIDNAAWTKTGVTVTANNATAPDGTLTADSVSAGGVSTDGFGQAASGAPASASTTWSGSVWLRTTSGTANVTINIDSTNEVHASTTRTVTTGWQRYTLTGSAFTAGSTGTVTLKITNGTAAVIAWGAQLEKTAAVNAYVRTDATAATTTGRGFVAQSAGPHVFASGNVGIANAAPDTRLTVGSTSSAANEILKVTGQADAAIQLIADTDNVTESDNPYLLLSQDNAVTRSILGINGASGVDPQGNAYAASSDNATLLGTLDANGALQFGTNGNVRMSISTTGNVAISSSTITAARLLHLSGDGAIERIASTNSAYTSLSDNMGGLELLITTANAADKYGSALKFLTTDGDFTTANPKFLAAIVPRSTEIYDADTKGGTALDFATFANGGGAAGVPTVRMTVDQSGFVGIGTTSPGYLLHARKDQNAPTDVTVENANGGTSGYAEFVLKTDTSATGGMWMNSSTQTAYGGASSVNMGGENIAGVTLVTTGGSQLKAVNGAVGVAGLASATANSLCYNTGVSGLSGFNAFATCSSSLRYKEDVRDLTIDVQKVLELRPVDFKWKDRDERSVGFIAEEVAELIPQVITYKNGQVEGIEYKLLTAYLVGVLKNHQARIDALSENIALDGAGTATFSEIIAEKVTAKEVAVDVKDVARRLVGREMIETGFDAKIVLNPAAKANSLVIVSFDADPGQRHWIAERHDGSFMVKLAGPALQNATFTYWIVGIDGDIAEPGPSSVGPPMPPAESPSEEPPAPSEPDPMPEPPPAEGGAAPEPEPEPEPAP